MTDAVVMPEITLKEVNGSALTATYEITGLSSAMSYDLIRQVTRSDDNERRYQVVGSYRNWKPPAGKTTVTVTDTEAALRQHKVGIWFSEPGNPLSFEFAYGGYTGPAPLAMAEPVALPAPGCGAVLQSTKTAQIMDVRIWDFDPVRYQAKLGELLPMGSRFPVIVADRREGRRVSNLTFYTRTLQEYRDMLTLLSPESGRIYPLWLRTADEDLLLLHDFLFVAKDITVEPASKAHPERKFFTVEAVEIDPRRAPNGVL